MGALSPESSLDRLTKLAQSGFRVDEVSSTEEHVVVELVRDDSRVTLTLDAEQSRKILAGHAVKASRAVRA